MASDEEASASGQAEHSMATSSGEPPPRLRRNTRRCLSDYKSRRHADVDDADRQDCAREVDEELLWSNNPVLSKSSTQKELLASDHGGSRGGCDLLGRATVVFSGSSTVRASTGLGSQVSADGHLERVNVRRLTGSRMLAANDPTIMEGLQTDLSGLDTPLVASTTALLKCRQVGNKPSNSTSNAAPLDNACLDLQEAPEGTRSSARFLRPHFAGASSSVEEPSTVPSRVEESAVGVNPMSNSELQPMPSSSSSSFMMGAQVSAAFEPSFVPMPTRHSLRMPFQGRGALVAGERGYSGDRGTATRSSTGCDSEWSTLQSLDLTDSPPTFNQLDNDNDSLRSNSPATRAALAGEKPIREATRLASDAYAGARPRLQAERAIAAVLSPLAFAGETNQEEQQPSSGAASVGAQMIPTAPAGPRRNNRPSPSMVLLQNRLNALPGVASADASASESVPELPHGQEFNTWTDAPTAKPPTKFNTWSG